MGVRGLQSFLKGNPTLSKKVLLSNTSLVIDGNNLFCTIFVQLCNSRRTPHYRCDIYGGDYVALAEQLRLFFNNLDQCGITPILVLDGSVLKSSQDVAAKEKRVKERSIERFETVMKLNIENPPGNIVIPQNIHTVCRSVVSSLGIQCIQSPYEADTEIARLANDLNCPVLTNDSDFIIYPLKQGFVMLDLFRYKELRSSQNTEIKSISCTIFSQQLLTKYMPSLKAENMPLLSILLGNDYVDASAFDKVLLHILPRYYNGPLQATSFAHRRIAMLLSWLQYKSLEEAIESILCLVSDKSRREYWFSIIKFLLRSYKTEACDTFERELDNVYPPKDDPRPEIQSKIVPSQYLRRLFESNGLTALVLDVIFHSTHYSYSAVDDCSLISSFSVNYRPLSVLVTLLRPRTYTDLNTYRQGVELKKDSFKIYDRLKTEYSEVILDPQLKLDKFGSLENLDIYSTICLEPSLKKSLLMATFHFNDDELNLMTDTVSKVFEGNFIQQSTTCMMLIKYIKIDTKLEIYPEFVEAIFVSLLYYASSNNMLKSDFTIDKVKNKVKDILPSSGTKLELSRRVVHFINTLHSAFNSYIALKTLLNRTSDELKIELFFNGVLIHRLTNYFKKTKSSFAILFQDLPVLKDLCDSIKVMVHCDN